MLLIVGWDGASANLLEPMVQAGKMPNFARLRSQGLWGTVRAPWPPVTFPSWTTFMTGVNPGRHGIFDFTRREPGAYRVHFVNSTWRRAPSIWSRLSAAGKRVCILGLPATYPPEPVNGVMICGFDTPVTTRVDRSFVYPPEEADGVLDAGGFPFADFQEFRVDRAWYAKARSRLLQGIAQKVRVAERFLRRERWDVFFLLFGESDTAAHHFWHFADPGSPFAPACAGMPVGNVVGEIYEALDDALGTLQGLAGDAQVLVLSDHGFGGAAGTRVHLNRWLERHGWLRFSNEARVGSVLGRLKPFMLRAVPSTLQRALFALRGGRWSNAMETSARFAGIDFRRSAAFSEELGYFPSIWLNVQGRDPLGVIAWRDYDQFRRTIRDALLAWRHPVTGDPLVRRVWFREELYIGPYVEEAPDLILQLAEEGGGYAVLAASSQGRSGPEVTQLDVRAWRGGKLHGLSGTHRRDGIFALTGPRISGGREKLTVAMEQFAPTVLELCGVRYPTQFFDGETFAHVVSEAAWIVHAETGMPVAARRVYTEDEEAEISKRLEDLGYFS